MCGEILSYIVISDRGKMPAGNLFKLGGGMFHRRIISCVCPNPAAFTLIELLIVVAIVAILAAIAVPNFLEAHIRAKVARAHADHLAIATALESYRFEQNAYPSAESNGSMKWIRWITTPVAFIARVDMDDPFTGPAAVTGTADSNLSYRTYRFYGFNEQGYTNARTENGEFYSSYNPPGSPRVLFYVLFSHGPDKVRSKGSNGKTFLDSENLFDPKHFIELIYDPSNGTVSNGEILFLGSNPIGRAAPALRLIQSK